MFENKIKIHNIFKEWLGEQTSQGDILVIFGGAIIATILLITGLNDELTVFPLWKSILFTIIAFDIIGGAIANFTVSTGRYYTQKAKKRWIFLAEHIVHLGLLYLVTGHILFWISIYIYTIFMAIIINLIKKRSVQEIMAPALTVIGCILFYSFTSEGPLFTWFPAIFMIKIIMGFAVRRTEEE